MAMKLISNPLRLLFVNDINMFQASVPTLCPELMGFDG